MWHGIFFDVKKNNKILLIVWTNFKTHNQLIKQQLRKKKRKYYVLVTMKLYQLLNILMMFPPARIKGPYIVFFLLTCEKSHEFSTDAWLQII